MPIYIDESGHTGYKLLDRDQPFFILASVDIEDEQAEKLISDTRSKFHLQSSTELKAKNLLKYENGKRAINYILSNIEGKYAIAINHKEYSLCCKFYEYIFEPVLQKNSMLFYEKDFHLFIANTLFVFVQSKDELAINMIANFAEMIRKKDIDAIRMLFISNQFPEINPILMKIINFIEGYIDLISDDLNIIDTNGSYGKWTLDLNVSSMCSLLRHWNKTIPEMTIFCDNSKPIDAHQFLFDAMVGRIDKTMIRLAGREYSPIFNLKQPIQMVDSQTSYGIQIADIVAGIAAFAMKNKDNDILQRLNDGIIEESVMPSLDNVDLNQKTSFINSCILRELSDRALSGKCPIEYMREYYYFIEWQYKINPP